MTYTVVFMLRSITLCESELRLTFVPTSRAWRKNVEQQSQAGMLTLVAQYKPCSNACFNKEHSPQANFLSERKQIQVSNYLSSVFFTQRISPLPTASRFSLMGGVIESA